MPALVDILIFLYGFGGATACQWRGRNGSADTPSDWGLVVIFIAWPIWVLALWNYNSGWRKR